MMTTDPTPLTDDEWRAFQAIQDQGYSHRAWVDNKIAQRVRKALAGALRDAANDLDLRLSGHSGISITRLRARADDIEKEN